MERTVSLYHRLYNYVVHSLSPSPLPSSPSIFPAPPSPPKPKKRKLGKDPAVDTSFLPDRDREVRWPACQSPDQNCTISLVNLFP